MRGRLSSLTGAVPKSQTFFTPAARSAVPRGAYMYKQSCTPSMEHSFLCLSMPRSIHKCLKYTLPEYIMYTPALGRSN